MLVARRPVSLDFAQRRGSELSPRRARLRQHPMAPACPAAGSRRPTCPSGRVRSTTPPAENSAGIDLSLTDSTWFAVSVVRGYTPLHLRLRVQHDSPSEPAIEAFVHESPALGDRLIVEVLDEEDDRQRIVSGQAKESRSRGTVLAVVPVARTTAATLCRSKLPRATPSIFSKYGGTKWKVDGNELLILAVRVRQRSWATASRPPSSHCNSEENKHMVTRNEFKREARAPRAGVNILADAVKVTLGPKGRYVVLRQEFGAPTITNDGVTIAVEIEVEEASRPGRAARPRGRHGDERGGSRGTTTATVLAQAIVREGLKNVAGRRQPDGLQARHRAGRSRPSSRTEDQSKEFSGKEDIARVATISSREREIGDVIADAIEKVGKDGVVNVGRPDVRPRARVHRGMQFDKGYLSPYMVTTPSAWRLSRRP